MIDFHTVKGDGSQNADGSITVWALSASDRVLTLHELRMRLFAWHLRSMHGILLKQDDDYQEGRSLVLSPVDALDYFASPGTSLHLPVEWSESLSLLRQTAELFRDVLDKGWYRPDAEAWQEGRRGWKLMLPEGLAQNGERLERELKAAQIDIRLWFDRIMEELGHSDEAVNAAWDDLCAEQPVLLAHAYGSIPMESVISLEEEDWLVSVGWQKDDIPFRTCFRLNEPFMDGDEDSAVWKLEVLLQDKDDSAAILPVEWSEGNVCTDRLPEAWAEHASRRVPSDLRRCLQLLPSLKASQDSNSIDLKPVLTETEAWDFLERDSLLLLNAGYSVLLPAWWEALMQHKPKLKVKLKSSVGSTAESLFGASQLVRFDWKVAVGGLDLSEDEFIRLAAEKKRLMHIHGRWIRLDPEFVVQVQKAMKRFNKSGLSFQEILEMHLLGQADQAEAPSEEDVTPVSDEEAEPKLRIEVELNNHMAKLIERMQHTDRIPIVAPSPLLQAELRKYQQDGVSWLLFMRKFGLGACLADDMGLGKTIQFIAYLLRVTEESEATRTAPALLICPTSVLGNWQKELERFAPTLRVYLHYGPQRPKGEMFSEAIRDFDLVITSYNLAQMDETELSSITWNAICLDEAQNIKNVYTKQSAAIRRLDARHRIALTGTPIENRLTELWSIFDFMNPGYLGSLSEFQHRYVQPIEKNGDEALIGRVQKLIRPFLLRRVKKDPAIQLDLPDKYESKAYVTLTAEQAALYENVVEDLMQRLDTLTGMEKKGLILATLTKLKQICDHPALFLKERDSSSQENRSASAKVTRLLEMLQEAREEGDQCLIFTQFVEMGHMLKATVEQEMGERVFFLHGGVPKKQRDAMIASFQAPDVPAKDRIGVFILSLKAGGTGLNLTAANHVFHFDRWWNPAVENQATDRAFRIGQTRDVQVHKFVTLGTLEERIDEMIERKQGLNRQVVGAGENWVTEMSTGELRDLFALRREWIGRQEV
ncbi:DEAD/DEAH box helicase [Paenibacillus elgii]